MTQSPPKSPRSLLVAYALPYFVYVGLGSIFDARSEPLALYGARAVVVSAALFWASRAWLPLRGPRGLLGSLAIGAAAGLAGTALWIALSAPFAPADAPPWDDTAWLARAIVATALPPLVEEPLMRGFVLGLVLLFERARRAGERAPIAFALDRASLATISPGQWSPLALVISSAAFASGHAPGEWVAGGAFGGVLWGRVVARGAHG